MKVDWLIVGAGFTGSVLAERIASQLEQKVLVVERRGHIGGNAYDYYDDHGVLLHKYGPHIFHTNSRKVWKYLSRFTKWRPYEHRVLAVIDGQLVPVPFNLTSLHTLFPSKYASGLENLLVRHYGKETKVPILKMREEPNPKLRQLADYIYENLFFGYTKKQWDLTPEKLAPSVTARVPIHISRDDRYFQDQYQMMPKNGYTAMFENMLTHPNIQVILNTNYCRLPEGIKFSRMIYTGTIDGFFDYVHGPLPYRSLRFEIVLRKEKWHQRVGTVNYPNDHEYTRITEMKHLTDQGLPNTALIFEYPERYNVGENDPYYPVPRDENYQLYTRYCRNADQLKSVFFAGRLGDYKYYNMDQAVARALTIFEKEFVE